MPLAVNYPMTTLCVSPFLSPFSTLLPVFLGDCLPNILQVSESIFRRSQPKTPTHMPGELVGWGGSHGRERA